MTVISSSTDPRELTLELVAEFDASPEQVWGVWEDPRKLERWWGPPGYPATFTRHDFHVGGQSRYHMTAPSGELHHGWWRIDELDEPQSLRFANGMASADGEPAPGLDPASGIVTLAATESGTRMTVLTRFVDAAQMETMLAMGMQQGMEMAIGQIDALLTPVAA
jgi:uncharacterized protein YndB with AHSA1/START domain